VLRRLILAFKANLKIFHEVLKPFLDAESGKNIIRIIFNLDDNFAILKRARINLDFE
jgi:hypothetical protein